MANTGRTLTIGVIAGLLTAGCLIKEEHHTWYLEPDSGAVTWVVLEQDVRSDAKTEAERALEELGFWNDVQAEDHGTARTFRELNATRIRTQVLRSRTPFGVLTEASFPSIDELGLALLTYESDAAKGSSTLERDGAVSEWTWTVPADWLDGDFPLRIVLVRGHFESAAGFVLSSDNRAATLEERDQGAQGPAVLRLRWSTGGGQ